VPARPDERSGAGKRFYVLLLIAVVAVALVPGVAAAVPANDNFAGATVLASLPSSVAQSAVGATEEVGEPTVPCVPLNSTVWFRYTPSSGLPIHADTIGSDYDTVVAVYTGSAVDSLTLVACDDDSGPGLQSELQFTPTPGVTYWFQVGDFGTVVSPGHLVLNLQQPAGHIIVSKVVTPGAPAAVFAFHRSWGAGSSLAGGGSVDSGMLLPGVYSVAEVGLPPGWSLASAVCDDGSSPAAIGVSEGEKVTCTFTNTYAAPPLCFGLPATMVGTAGADTLTGTAGDDVIVGLGGDDTISGLGGSDRICGGAGADQLLSGDGLDRLRGGSGNDRLGGGPGADILRGKAGDDLLVGGTGIDLANGGLGTDTCVAETTTACE